MSAPNPSPIASLKPKPGYACRRQWRGPQAYWASHAKGPVFDTAVVAGVMAAKRTSELIPFCHPLALEQCRIDIELPPGASGAAVIVVHCRVEVQHKTGVEMEALTGASVAALTIYDMCKALISRHPH